MQIRRSRTATRPSRTNLFALFLITVLAAGGLLPSTGQAQHPTAVTSITNSSHDTTLEVNHNGSLLMPGAVVYDGTANDSIPAEGAGTRLMWYPAKAAFRAGRVFGSRSDVWDADNIGGHSVGFGANTKASGNYATAMGRLTTASGYIATAMGLVTTASGNQATAMGDRAIASGNQATAMGIQTTASGEAATAMGSATTASGVASTAMGSETSAGGANATAMGFRSTATGYSATAMGTVATAGGSSAVAMGYRTDASAGSSTALGAQTTASGYGATATGSQTTATGFSATAMGQRTTAQAYASLVIGRDNVTEGTPGTWMTTDPLFVAGNGTSSTPSNALELEKDGDLTIAGSLTESSDRRLKAEVEPLGVDILRRLAEIRAVRFRFRPGTGHPTEQQLGVIAQEVQRPFPELVTRGSDGYLSVAYPKLTAVLLKGLQEQQEILNEKQKQIDAILERVERLEEPQTSRSTLAASSRPLYGWLLGLLAGSILAIPLHRFRRQ